MVERWLGEEPFRDGVRQYLTQHQWGNANAQDMFNALSRASGRDVASVATSFLDQPGVPLVEAKLACDGAPRVELSQRQYRGHPGAPESPRRWTIPPCFPLRRATTKSTAPCATARRRGYDRRR